ncbi:MAG: polyphosphate polymerase domain-containing protein [Chloroflexi bacterium]|nr:polyphosphate polymerase domain-containing protein [Chloroflexota bacterium]
MTSTLPNLRYEKKLLADGATLAEVLTSVRRHPSAFREVYPPRTVNNIYLDSPARRDYHEHINGTANRSKTRVRWYGQQFEVAERPMLERKLKRGTVSGKRACPLPPLSINGSCLRSSLNGAFDTAVFPPIWRSSLRHLEPALVNRYQRHYFLSRDGKFRLTVDSGLQTAGVQPNARAVVFSLPVAGTVIIELKFGLDAAEDASLVTNPFPFRVARFSKYVAGIERL